MRTSKLKIFIRAFIIIFAIYMLLAAAWNSITLTNFWSTWEMAVSALLTVLLFGSFCWLFTNLGIALFHGRDPQYRQWKLNGGDPYFDSLPWPINPDRRITRETGLQEPSTSFFPGSWKFQCPACGARVQKRIDVCWNCLYGSDGDSTAYFKRFGDVKPPEIDDEQWSNIKSRHLGCGD